MGTYEPWGRHQHTVADPTSGVMPLDTTPWRMAGTSDLYWISLTNIRSEHRRAVANNDESAAVFDRRFDLDGRRD